MSVDPIIPSYIAYSSSDVMAMYSVFRVKYGSPPAFDRTVSATSFAVSTASISFSSSPLAAFRRYPCEASWHHVDGVRRPAAKKVRKLVGQPVQFNYLKERRDACR